ncbi:hypothetical protein Catovirus_2_295 [Catovirus CTV1]|uniref:Uncharacterized protein n=1 Tax=Catovirus CTV1 TaxID=1977631 RepID=A0A1V0SCB0_9VIRU|nr:hypothetical protein Catovirus_2_295 [Catovirus CTV1]
MTSYSNINDAFNITEYDELDKMARELNNKKIYGDKYSKYIGDDFPKDNKFHFFSAQGNLIDDHSNDYNNSYLSPTEDSIKIQNTDKSTISHIEQDSKDSFILSLQNQNKQKKNVDKLLNIIKSSHHDDSSSSDNIDGVMQHIKNCNKCKKKLKNFINDNNHVFPSNKKLNHLHDSDFEKKNIKQDSSLDIFESDTKNIIIAILVGIGIIFILDIFWRSGNY